MYIPRNKKIKSNIYIQRSSVSTQIINSTVIDISGTEVSYTPTSGASKVIYEFTIQYHNDPDTHNNFYFEIQKNTGSGYSAVGQGYRVNHTYQYVSGQNTVEGRFVLDSWTGSNSLKITARSYDNAREATLLEDEAGNHFDPIIKVYSLM